MAYLNWKTAVYIFIVILVNIWAHAASGVLIVKPQNTSVLAGQVATLNCSTSSTEDVHWYYGTSYVYAGRKLYQPYNNRLEIEVYQNDGATAFNLLFPSAKPEDAGMYICRDNQGQGETSSAEVTVLSAGGNGTCQSNMKPDGIVIPNDCNIDPDEVQLSCSVTFYGNNPPKLEWKKVPEKGDRVANTECQTVNNRIMCNSSIIGDRQMNHSSFVCQMTGSFERSISLCTIPVKNLIYAFNGRTTTKSSVNNEVQCNLDTSQSCHYKWKHSDIVASTSRTITPDITGLYQCEAECNIRGKRCIVFDYAYISDGDSTSCSTGSVVGICVAVMLLLMLIETVICCFLLRKEKGKNLQLSKKSPTDKDLEEDRMQKELIPLLETKKSPTDKDLEEDRMQKEQIPLMETNEPNLIRTLIPKVVPTVNKAVFGLTILGEEVFVLINGWPKIEVFGDLKKLEPRREFLLTGPQLEIPWDMQSSSKHNCLYIVDKKRNEEEYAEIVKIDPDGFIQKRWTTECIAGRLSVTNECNVIFTSLYKRRISEYTPDGDLIRLIELPSDIVKGSPLYTLKRKNEEYVVAHGNRGEPQHGVCVIDRGGKVKHSFGGRKGPGNDQLYVPDDLAAYSDGHVLVVDKDNRRVVLLSPDFKFRKALFSEGDELRSPNRICLDESNKRLMVADNLWISDKIPWTDGRVLVFDMSSK